MKISRKLKRLVSPYNLAILASVILIFVGMYMFLKPEKKFTPSGIEVATTKVKDNEEISKDKAIKLALEQFEILGEKKLSEEDLEVLEIIKQKEDYYYISSPKNTVEIKIKGGIVTMINSATVVE